MFHSYVLLSATLSGFLVTWLLVPLLKRRGVLDVPNERSSHVIPTPRGGGIGILAGFAVGLAVANGLGTTLELDILLGMGVMAAIGLADDYLGGLSAGLRLLLQILAASIVVYGSGGMELLPLPAPLDLPLGWASAPFTVFWIVSYANIYNFLDGIDGLAGLQGLIAGLAVAACAPAETAVMGLAMAGGCAGFLVSNWHPAKIFMGDVGSGAIGFMFGALPVTLGDGLSASRMAFSISIFLWFFLSDGSFTIFCRLLRGEKVWQAHRSHLYQRLVRTGLSHARVSVNVGVGALLLCVPAVLAMRERSAVASWLTLLLAVAGFAVYYVFTRRRELGQ